MKNKVIRKVFFPLILAKDQKDCDGFIVKCPQELHVIFIHNKLKPINHITFMNAVLD